jgi:transcriptional regulator with XRE-family HTH domain
MERIGEKLRKRREELGFTIDDIARATNFRPELIRAVEGGRAAAFPAEAYLNAFLRAYASKLDLDPREIILEQKSEEERIHDALSGIKTSGRQSLAIPRWLTLALIVAAVAIGLFVVYDRVLKESLRSGESGPGIGAVEEAASGAEIPDSGAVGAEQAAPEAEQHMPGQEQAGGTGVPGTVERGAEEAALKEKPDSLSISVSGWSTHIRLRSGDKVLLDQTLSPGYRRTFYSRQAFHFDHITNKDAVSLLYNGRPVRLPNSSGSKLVSDLWVPPDGR